MPYIGRHLDRGNYLKLDDISSSFDGVETTFNLTNGGSPFYPGSAFSILVVLAGVIQEAESAYQIDQSQITFASAPLASDSFFCIVLGTALGINVPGNGTVGGTQLTKPFSYDGFFYLNDTTNRVGINSSSPTTALDVQGTVTATEFVGNLSNTSGISTFYDLTVENDLTVNGSFSTLDTVVTEVDKLEVGANNSTVGVAITQSGSGDILRLYDDATQVVTVLDGGNVGINTASPTQKLHVGGNISLGDRSGTGSQYLGFTAFNNFGGGSGHIEFTRDGSTNTGLRFRLNGTEQFRFISGTSTELMRLDNLGRLGIGTDDASWGVSTGLIVGDGASAKGITLFSNSANVGDFAFADATSGTARYRGLIRYDHSDDSLAFRTNSTERLRINSSGNVGIGTDDPRAPLNPHGTAALTNLAQTVLITDSNADDAEGRGGNLGFSGYVNGSLRTLAAIGGLKTDAGNSFNGDLALYTRTNGQASLNERLRITSTGFVGIGETSPSSKFEIVSGDTASVVSGIKLKNDSTSASGPGSSIDFVVDGVNDVTTAQIIGQRTSANYHQGSLQFLTRDSVGGGLLERLRINSSGNVGIGTDNPGQKLYVNQGNILINQNGTSASLIVTTDTNRDANVYFGDSDSQSQGRIRYNNSADYLSFSTAGAANERLRIDSSGNVGINTTTPADTLDVNGNVLPSFDATHDLGSASKRWNNVYTTDLQLSNEGSSNDVDGSWGRWTIQEGEDDLFLINRRNGKKYKFVLQEVN